MKTSSCCDLTALKRAVGRLCLFCKLYNDHSTLGKMPVSADSDGEIRVIVRQQSNVTLIVYQSIRLAD